jgi:hypothetical protein
MVDPGVGFGPLSLDPVITGGEPVRGDLRHGDEAYPWYSWDSILITGYTEDEEGAQAPGARGHLEEVFTRGSSMLYAVRLS